MITIKRSLLLLLILSFLVSAPLGAHSVEDIRGVWSLHYSSGFGYEFRFRASYRAYVILYLQNQVLVFRGVYNIDDEKTIRINISEIKEQRRGSNPEAEKGFVKTSSSLFLFDIASLEGKKMEVQPKKIQIDGRSSDGYFEPNIKLTKK